MGPLALPDPRPLAADEVLIEVRAAGVGNWDEFVRLGQWDLGRRPPMALTAHQALSEGVRLRAEDRLLVHGGGGVTGRLLARLGCLSGARVVVTAGPSSADALSCLGVESVVDYHDEDWPQVVRKQTGGVTAAVNAVPGQEARALSTVADGGRFATITGSPPDAQRGVTIANIYVRPDGAQLRELAGRFGRGELTIGVGAVYELKRAPEAFRLVMGGGAGGAVALEFSVP